MTRPSFSAAMLHSEVLATLKHAKPERNRWEDPKKVERKKTPIYILTSEDPKSLSIELCRRNDPSPPSSSQSSTKSLNPNLDIYSSENLNKASRSGKLLIPHVLVSVALEKDQNLDVDQWYRWIRQFPALAKYVLVEGVFASHSTALLVSLPVFIWDLLPNDLAVSFVAYVESRNLLSNEIQNREAISTETGLRSKNWTRDDDLLQMPKSGLVVEIERALELHKKEAKQEWDARFATEKARLENEMKDSKAERERNGSASVEEPALLEKRMADVMRESKILKEEARRAWEELGRREHEERERTIMLQEGIPVVIGGVQVVPMEWKGKATKQ
jgi:hypothetical protein